MTQLFQKRAGCHIGNTTNDHMWIRYNTCEIYMWKHVKKCELYERRDQLRLHIFHVILEYFHGNYSNC